MVIFDHSFMLNTSSTPLIYFCLYLPITYHTYIFFPLSLGVYWQVSKYSSPLINTSAKKALSGLEITHVCM